MTEKLTAMSLHHFPETNFKIPVAKQKMVCYNIYCCQKNGPVAQLGERSVRIREVKGSNPSRSTRPSLDAIRVPGSAFSLPCRPRRCLVSILSMLHSRKPRRASRVRGFYFVYGFALASIADIYFVNTFHRQVAAPKKRISLLWGRFVFCPRFIKGIVFVNFFQVELGFRCRFGRRVPVAHNQGADRSGNEERCSYALHWGATPDFAFQAQFFLSCRKQMRFFQRF